MKKSFVTITLIAFAMLLANSCNKNGGNEDVDVPVTITETGTPTATTISVSITPAENAAMYSYAIGIATDLSAFTDGTLPGIKQVAGNHTTITTFTDLDAEVAYTVFARATDKDGNKGQIATLVITPAATVPYVSIKYNEITTMTVDIKATPNNLVSKYYSMVVSKELYPDFVDMFGDGDEIAFMETMFLYDMASNYTTTSNELWYINGETSYEYYTIILAFDLEGNPCTSVIKKEFASPDFIAGLPDANVAIEVSDITPTSVKIKFTPDNNTFGYYSGTMKGSDYDALQTDEDFESLRQELAFYSNPYMEEDIDTWTISVENTDYVAVASPFNANGIDGYGPLAVKRFSTMPAGMPALSSEQVHTIFRFNETKHKKALTSEKMLETFRK